MLSNNTQVLKQVNTQVVCFDNTFVLGLEPMNLTYGQRLKAARKNKKLSQMELAEISGVGQGSISKIERGDQESSAFDVELSHHLGVNPMWLKTGDKELAPSWLTGKSETPLRSLSSADFEALMSAATPRSHSALETIEKAYNEGQLTDTDLQLLNAIAERFKKSAPK